MYLAMNNQSEHRTYFAQADKGTGEVVLRAHAGMPLRLGADVVFEERFVPEEALALIRAVRDALEDSKLVKDAHAAVAAAEAALGERL